MKNKIVSFILFLTTLLLSNNIESMENFRDIYPPVIQQLDSKLVFHGDRHGEFEGDLVAFLSDGSAWKVHPTEREAFENWRDGDLVRIKVRTDHYWFKREHKFSLYNESRGDSLKVMIVNHIQDPDPLQIVSVDTYSKGYVATYEPRYEWIFENGHWHDRTTWLLVYKPGDFRKVLGLSDGSCWVIKENFDNFVLGAKVYIGAQGIPKKWYDFVMITGTEREAVWSYGRPHRDQ